MSTFGGVFNTSATALATSSAASIQLASDRAEKFVATEPGLTMETFTPDSRSSSMSDSLNPITACLVAA